MSVGKREGSCNDKNFLGQLATPLGTIYVFEGAL